jgi:hypothetical protein
VSCQPSQRDRTNNRDQASPKERAATRGIDRTQEKIGADQLAVVLFEIAVEFRYLNEFRRSIRHKGLPTMVRVPHKSLICPTGQVPMNRIGRRTILAILLIVALAIVWNVMGGR